MEELKKDANGYLKKLLDEGKDMALEGARQQVESALKEYLTDAGRDALQMVFDELGRMDLGDAVEQAKSILDDPKKVVESLLDRMRESVDEEKLVALVTALLASQLQKGLETSGRSASVATVKKVMAKIKTITR